MNFGKAIILTIVTMGVIVYMPDLLGGVVDNESEIRTTATLIGDITEMIPLSGEEILGLILIAGVFILISKSG